MKQHVDGSLLTDLTENLNHFDSPLDIGLLVSRQLQGFFQRRCVAAAQSQRQRTAADFRQRGDQFVGQIAERAAGERRFKALQQRLCIVGCGRKLEQLRTRDEIATRPGHGVASHHALGDVLFDQRQAPEIRIAEHLDELLAPFVGLRFDRPPDQQRVIRVVDVFVPMQQASHDRDRLRRGQSPCRASKLAAGLDMRLGLRQRRELRREQAGNFVIVTQQPHGPAADVRIFVLQRPNRQRFVKTSRQIQRPEVFQGQLSIGLEQQLVERRHDRRIAQVAQ